MPRKEWGAWLPMLFVLVAVLAIIVGPGVAAAVQMLSSKDGEAASYVPMRGLGGLLGVSVGYALLVAAGAMLIGWGPGRCLGRALGRRTFLALVVVLLTPMCLPAYVVFYAWWQAWPADSALHAWAIAHDRVVLLRQATLVVSLVCWSWPIVAWCVAGGAAAVPPEHEEMMRLDGASLPVRLLARARADARGLAVGGLLVFLATLGNTTCFDLAGVFTFGNELRAMDAAGVHAGAVLVAALPALAAAAVGAIVVWRFLGAGPPMRAARRRATVGRGELVIALLALVLSLAPPVVAVAGQAVQGAAIRQFIALYGPALLGTGLTAAVSAGLAAGLAICLALLWLDERRWPRVLAHAVAIGLLVTALAPGTVAAIGLEAAYNGSLVLWRQTDQNPNPPLVAGTRISDVTLADVVYRRRAILVLAHLMRFGFVSALLGRWIATREPRELAELRRVDGGGHVPGTVRALGPRLLAAAAATTAVVFVLASAEIPVTARVHPPGSDPIAVALLNAMHYQRPETVMIAVAIMLVAALLAATIAAVAALGPSARRLTVIALTAAPLLVLGGCGRADASTAQPLRTRVTFGTTGTTLGQFSYPRCLAVDAERERVFIVDKTARVQRYGFDGTPELEWRMPARENGKPTGVSVAPDGRVFVADTHYFRIIAYDPDGRELMRFGEHGEGPGQFIYPTDVAFGPEGRMYVSEYGGNDRVQVFSADGEFLFTFGEVGEGVGQFTRPQSMTFNADRTELFIADACNHRIVVVDPAGVVLRTFGEAGLGLGQLHYPYDLMLLDDDTLLVCEFGNNRLQHFDVDGTPLEILGCLGTGPGELRYPWGVDGSDDVLFVLDSGNNRVQRLRTP